MEMKLAQTRQKWRRLQTTKEKMVIKNKKIEVKQEKEADKNIVIRRLREEVVVTKPMVEHFLI